MRQRRGVKAAMSFLLRVADARRWVWRAKPILKYVEMHLTDHCNLNCKGCRHFCPVADRWFVKSESLAADLKQLSRLFQTIPSIRLLGGEPLLHPDVNELITITRRAFPRSDVHLVTNGLLLGGMNRGFWQTCKSNNVVIDVSRYPLSLDYEAMRELASKYGVQLDMSDEIHEFLATMNPKGDSDPVAAMTKCRSHWYCPFIKDGRIYPCAISAVMNYYGNRFDADVPEIAGIDIHQGITGWQILEALEKPVSQCRFCATKYRSYDWNGSKREMVEWTA